MRQEPRDPVIPRPVIQPRIGVPLEQLNRALNPANALHRLPPRIAESPASPSPRRSRRALFQLLSLIISAGASTPCAAGRIFATTTCPNVCCRTSALFANPVTPRPRTASIAIVFLPALQKLRHVRRKHMHAQRRRRVALHLLRKLPIDPHLHAAAARQRTASPSPARSPRQSSAGSSAAQSAPSPSDACTDHLVVRIGIVRRPDVLLRQRRMLRCSRASALDQRARRHRAAITLLGFSSCVSGRSWAARQPVIPPSTTHTAHACSNSHLADRLFCHRLENRHPLYQPTQIRNDVRRLLLLRLAKVKQPRRRPIHHHRRVPPHLRQLRPLALQAAHSLANSAPSSPAEPPSPSPPAESPHRSTSCRPPGSHSLRIVPSTDS